MARINTNLSSLRAQHRLGRTNEGLKRSIERLSSGLRINNGRDDPAGLASSEVLRSDIVGVRQAITNSQRAGQLVATADSALGEVGSLLLDIRSLVQEAANSATLSADQLAANQIQIDASLEAIDRVSASTSFQGKRLLDGNLDFITQGVDDRRLSDLTIGQASLGDQGEVDVRLEVRRQAERGLLNFADGALPEGAVLEISGSQGAEVFDFGAGTGIEQMAVAINLVSDATGVEAVLEDDGTPGELVVTSPGGNNDIRLDALQAGADASDVRIKYTKGDTNSTKVAYVPASGEAPATIDVQLQMQGATPAAVTGLGAGNRALDIAATTEGRTFNGTDVRFVSGNGTAAGITANFIQRRGLFYGDNSTTPIDNSNDFYVQVRPDSDFDGANGGEITMDFVDAAVAPTAELIGNTLRLTADFSNAAMGVTAAEMAWAVNNSPTTSAVFQSWAAGAGDDQIGAGIVARHNGDVLGETGTVQQTRGVIDADGDTDETAADIVVTARAGRAFDGLAGNGVILDIAHDEAPSVTFDETTGVLSVRADTTSEIAYADMVFAGLNNDTRLTADGTNASTDRESYNNVKVMLDTAPGAGGANHMTAVYNDVAKELVLTFDSTEPAITSAMFDAALAVEGIFTRSANPNGEPNDLSGVIDGTALQPPANPPTEIANTAATGDNASTGEEVRNLLNAAWSVQGNPLTQFFTFAGGDANPVSPAIAGSSGLLGENNPGLGGPNSLRLGTGDPTAVEGVGYNHELAEFDDMARSPVAAMPLPGNNTDLILSAQKAGTAYNNVTIVLAKQAGGGGLVNGAGADYNEGAKTLTITIDQTMPAIDVSAIRDAVAAEGTFVATLDTSIDTTNDGSGSIDPAAVSAGVIGSTGNSGGEGRTLYFYIDEWQTSANGLISALGREENERVASLFDIQNTDGSNGWGSLFAATYADALQGGTMGGSVAATAQDVVNAINATDGLKEILAASLVEENSGANTVAAFDHFAHYGSVEDDNRIQFLAPADAPDIRFVAMEGSELCVDLATDPAELGQSTATLSAENADASLVFQARREGPERDDVVVRFTSVRFDQANTVRFEEQLSRATARLELGAGHRDVRLTAGERGANFNDVEIHVVRTGAVVGDDAQVSYDGDAKRLTIDISAATSANTLIDRVNAEGTFEAALDYIDQTNNNGSGTGLLFDNTQALADTGSTGGHEGGTLEFLVKSGTTADEIVSLLNADDLANDYFTAETYGASGAGQIDLENDSNAAVTSGGLIDPGTMVVRLETDAIGRVRTTARELVDFLDQSRHAQELNVSASLDPECSGNGQIGPTDDDITWSTTGTRLVKEYASGETVAAGGRNARLRVTAKHRGATFDEVAIVYRDDLALGDPPTAEYDHGERTLTIHIAPGGATTASQAAAAVNRDLASVFSAEARGTGAGIVTTSDAGTISGGLVDRGSVDGVPMDSGDDSPREGLSLRATEYGAGHFVEVNALSGSLPLRNTAGELATRSVGVDADVRVNGAHAVAHGLSASLDTSTLDLSLELDESVASGDVMEFTITGSGARFQLGSEVVTNQQARLGIPSINTTSLGGRSGYLQELRSGNGKSLENDVFGAARVVEEVIKQVAMLRGRLGAFQRSTLDPNIQSLGDTVESLTQAESSIRDADFATESARLVKRQLLSQSGLTVLSIANNRPQDILALLQT
jgi:flagellin-like hook-associated protein FlgL